jgi:hypothetical protein
MKDATHFIEQYRHITDTENKWLFHTKECPIACLPQFLRTSKQFEFKTTAVFFIKAKIKDS